MTSADGALLAGTSGGLVALDAASGAVVWERPELGWTFAPIVKAGTAWAGTRRGDVLNIEAATGRTRWRSTYAGWLYTPALADGVVVTGGRAAVLRGLDADSGQTLWSRPLSQELVDRPVTVSASRVAVATFDGRLLVVRAATGETVWSRRLGTPIVHLAGGVAGIHALTMGGTLVSFAANDGERRWRRHLDGRPGGFTVAGDRLLVQAGRDSVIALDRRSGRIAGRGHLPGRLAAPPLPDGRIVLRPGLRVQPLELAPGKSSSQHAQRGG